MRNLLILFTCLILVVSCGKQQVSSPDNRLQVSFDVSDEGCPLYCVTQDGDTVIDWSSMGFSCEEADLTCGFKIIGKSERSHESEWETVWGEERTIQDVHKELEVRLKHQSGLRMNIVFRVFDDGFAFRYAFPKPNGKELTITDERTEYRFTADHAAWSIPWRTEYYEGLWTKSPLSEKRDTLCSPITLELANGGFAFVHEAALTDYPAQNLYMADGALRTYLTPWLDSAAHETPVKAYVQMPFATPWRMVILAHDLPQMVASRIMLNLNEPCQIEDTSWIKPMKFIGIWWGMHKKSMTWEQGPKHGATTENMERYMRFAKEHHIDAVLAEGWNKGWEDWKHFSFTEPYDDWDMDYLSRLADSLGVQIIGHNETGGNAADYEAVLDEAYAYHRAHGIHVIKTGYVAPIIRTKDGLQWNKGQSGVRHYRKVIETAARYRIAIDNHEPVMPTGLQRTWPNLMSQEGVRGQEWNAWSADGGNPCEHVTVLPFTRIMAGPVDFTPGVFNFENPAMPQTRVHSTLANQLALFVCFYSPLQMACDLPENYMEYPEAFGFIEDVPCDWEKSMLIDGVIGDYCVFARKERGGDDWYIGGITDEQWREVAVPFSMLDPDKSYRAYFYHDIDEENVGICPTDWVMEEAEVTCTDTAHMEMLPGGGFAIRIHREDQ
jgi:alpha-glucosidase